MSEALEERVAGAAVPLVGRDVRAEEREQFDAGGDLEQQQSLQT
jgi:hypothetical protein